MDETEICPLRMVACGGAIGAGLCNCIKESCAWYVRYFTSDGKCALTDIAASLTELVQR